MTPSERPSFPEPRRTKNLTGRGLTAALPKTSAWQIALFFSGFGALGGGTVGERVQPFLLKKLT